MKNKKADQIEAKRKHKESLKSSRRIEPTLQRNEPTRPEKQTILIVCEGKNTEPSYFNQFKLVTATVKSVGEGYNTVTLIERAKVLSKEGDYDQVWCVFDADPKLDDKTWSKRFNRAIKLCEKYKFGIAYSNQAFEYWIILHLDDHQGGGMHRNDYNDKINSLLNPFRLEYDGNGTKLITEEIFEVLDGYDVKYKKARRTLAIDRAKRIYNSLPHTDPSKEESSTTVFRLVEELLKYL